MEIPSSVREEFDEFPIGHHTDSPLGEELSCRRLVEMRVGIFRDPNGIPG
jgi:hypothetical protein